MWLDDLATILEAATVGVRMQNIFLSSNASVPSGPGPFLTIIQTGGMGPSLTQDVDGIAYENPSAQLTFRGDDYPITAAMAQAAINAIAPIKNQDINGVAYVYIKILQSPPMNLSADETGRARLAFNVLGMKRPS